MNKDDYISTLPQAEQKALSVCGIYKAEQLQHIHLQSLVADMRQAASFFPTDVEPISAERLAEIYQEAIGSKQNDIQAETEPEEVEDKVPATNEYERTLPPLVQKHRNRQTKTKHNAEHSKSSPLIGTRSNAICSTRPFRTYISAWLQIWLIVSIILAIIVTYRLLTGIDQSYNLNHIGAILASGIVPYLFFSRRTKCSVCNMSVFTMQKYTRNKHAHRLPILGYSLTTALHIIFFFWFRCPACGTAQKLSRRKRR